MMNRRDGNGFRGMLFGATVVYSLGAGLAPTSAKEGHGLMTPAPAGDITTVTWALPYAEPETLDWIYAWDYGAQNTILANLCEGLLRVNPDGTSSFALATSVENPDKLTYIYKLREGVTFTDGKPMAAEDVAFSLNRNIKAEPGSYWGLWYANVSEIKATGPLEVTVKLSKPDVLFHWMLSTPVGYVGEKAFIEKAGTDYGTAAGGVMCTGPYQIDSWNPGQDITLKRNDAYWDVALNPKAATIRFVSIIDPSSLAAALQTGEVDGAWAPATTILSTLRTAGNGDLYMNSGTEVVVMQPASLTGALADKRVREALRAVIDYKGIVQGILGGAGEVNTTLTPASIWGNHRSSWEKAIGGASQPLQDLEKAKRLIAEIGVPVSPIVIAVNADDVQIVSVLTVIQNAAASVGLPVDVRRLSAQEYLGLFEDPAAREGYDLFASMVTSDISDPLELYSQIGPGAPYNFSGLDDPAFTKPLLAALAEQDPAKRADLTAQAEKGLIDGAYYFPLYSPYSRVYLGERITGVPVSTLSQLYYPWAATLGQR
ncbi:ABC transporter substrate-binding protein [Agrobacterium tumefaciens]|uniref:ABC transporter substrate-binding protein n=1 Tax=Agrobacterium tumefaciens TaxID=358 RepID=UPI001573DB8B|nr:ABC transporter substrate-binding protein [Agrobacterium tumefaciens]NTE68238.1 ABC transporter substrate-binding protein [Agrobacterium tumefaciens]